MDFLNGVKTEQIKFCLHMFLMKYIVKSLPNQMYVEKLVCSFSYWNFLLCYQWLCQIQHWTTGKEQFWYELTCICLKLFFCCFFFVFLLWIRVNFRLKLKQNILSYMQLWRTFSGTWAIRDVLRCNGKRT